VPRFSEGILVSGRSRGVGRRSFTQAAHDLDLSRSDRYTDDPSVRGTTGVRLLQRTPRTPRTVRSTLDGGPIIGIVWTPRRRRRRRRRFLGAEPKGMFRIEVQGTIARDLAERRLVRVLGDTSGSFRSTLDALSTQPTALARAWVVHGLDRGAVCLVAAGADATRGQARKSARCRTCPGRRLRW
jgi:hypothetical protein